MSKLLVNIRGCNGSGKSTIPISMMDDPDMYIVEKPYNGKSKRILTVFPSYGWVALGSYFNKTGGLDTFPNNKFTKKVLKYCIRHYPEYDILMEGIIASTIYSTYRDLFKLVKKRYSITPVVINFIPPLDIAINRIYQRNCGKPINEDAVENKWNIVKRNHFKFKDDGFISLIVDTNLCKKQEMLGNFLDVIDEIKERL